jgi:large subunit ribosomal protein L22
MIMKKTTPVIEHKVILRHLRIAPRKVRAVAGLIRGLSVNQAEAQLMVQRRRPAEVLTKLLRSALAGAKQGGKLDMDKLFIAEIKVDGGVMLKRMLPRARGQGDPIHKHSSHVTLVLRERDKNVSPYVFKAKEKKKLKPESEKPASKKRGGKVDDENQKETGKHGFFRKMFSRKAI